MPVFYFTKQDFLDFTVKSVDYAYISCNRHSVLTVGNTVAEINEAILVQFYGPSRTFYFTDFVEQNGGEENYIKLLLVELL
jgi:hypothetical protein